MARAEAVSYITGNQIGIEASAMEVASSIVENLTEAAITDSEVSRYSSASDCVYIDVNKMCISYNETLRFRL